MSEQKPSAENQQQTEHLSFLQRFTGIIDLRYAIAGGALAAITSFFGAFAVGQISDFRALALIEAISPSVLFLSSAIMTACATILALILTFLSLNSSITQGGKKQIKASHYLRMKQIGLMSIIALILSLILLLLVSVPLKETEDLPTSIYEIIYYVIIITASILGGLFVMLTLSLYNAIRGVITVFHPDAVSELIEEDQEDEEKTEQEKKSDSDHA